MNMLPFSCGLLLRRKRRLVLTFLICIFILSITSLLSQDYEPSCTKPQNNFVYIKMIKCASETLASVFRRYAFTRNLSVVLPFGEKLYLGWPYPIDAYSYRPAKTDHGFNIMVDHAIYNEVVMDDLMQPDNVYITSIREPYSQFKSMFNYYKLQMNCKIPGNVKDPVSEYLHNIKKYEAIYKSPEMSKTRFCIPNGYSMSHNLMAFNLGFPTGVPDGSLDVSDDESAIDFFLTRLESKFKLVLIVEYFDESMVLLRRLMCWGIKDILYSRRNVGQYVTVPSSEEKSQAEQENIEIYKKWSHVDYRLYDHFRKVFWTKVRNEGMSFYKELTYYRRINRIVNKFCEGIESGELQKYNRIFIEGVGYGDGFRVDANFCKNFRSSMLVEVKAFYDQLSSPPDFEKRDPKRFFC